MRSPLLRIGMAACALALACAAPSAAAVGDLSYFDCVGQGSFGCTDLNPTAGVLDDAAAVTVVGPDVYAVGEASNAVSHHLRLGGGKLLFTNCIGQGSLGCTDLNPTATAISGAVAIAASPDGKDVYVAGYLADAIAHFARSDATGNLTFKDCVSFNQFGCTKIFATTDALDGPRAIAISPDGA